MHEFKKYCKMVVNERVREEKVLHKHVAGAIVKRKFLNIDRIPTNILAGV